MVRPSIRVAVFAGAGASCFAGLPTVCSFFKRAGWPPSHGFEAACQEIARRISISEANEENLAWPDFDAEKLFGWLEILERAGRIHGQSIDIHVPNLRFTIPADAVISHLRKEIVRIYGSKLATETLLSAPHQSLFKLLDDLTPRSDPLYVFTTNYDTVLEQLFEDAATSQQVFRHKLRVCTGFSSARPGQWQPALLSEKPKSDERLIHLVKLHGSATWKRDDAQQPIETGWRMPTDQDCLLYFGYKSVPEHEPFFTLHTLLKIALLQCEAVIVIGFRVADPYIRELFDFALRSNTSLRVVCSLTRPPEPNSALSTMMHRFPGRVVLLADPSGKPIPFGHESFPEILEQSLRNAGTVG